MKKRSSKNSSKYNDSEIEEFEGFEDFLDNDIFDSDLSGNKDFIFNSKKSGLLFPTIVILSAVILSAFIMFLSVRFINSDLADFETVTTDNDVLESALMSKFKTDTDKKIKVKDEEINIINNKLKNYDDQLQNLREIVFAKQYGGEISPKAKKAEYSDLSISELEKTIKKIEDEKKIAEKELDIETEEKKQLLKESENQKNTAGKTAVSGMINISEIQKRLEKEKSVETQIYLFQRNIFYSLEENNYDKARENINNYKTLIYLPSNNDLPEIYQIRESSENLITIFEDYISLQQGFPKENIKTINDNTILIEFNLLYSRIMDDIEEQNLDSARINIRSLKTLLTIESNSDYPEIISRKSDYLRSTAILEEYIALKYETENYNRLSQSDMSQNHENMEDFEPDAPENIYTDFAGKTSLYGKIASLEDQRISIETFFNLMIFPGDSFIIIKDEKEIAQGLILSVTAASARGEITNIKSIDNPPAVNTLVYIARK